MMVMTILQPHAFINCRDTDTDHTQVIEYYCRYLFNRHRDLGFDPLL